jgi:hypothetical protein
MCLPMHIRHWPCTFFSAPWNDIHFIVGAGSTISWSFWPCLVHSRSCQYSVAFDGVHLDFSKSAIPSFPLRLPLFSATVSLVRFSLKEKTGESARPCRYTPGETDPGGPPEPKGPLWPFRAGNVLAALPNLALAGIYALTLFRGVTVFGLTAHWLTVLMGIEFLVIHSFPFMMFIAAAKPPEPAGKRCQKALFWGLLSLYLLGALKMGGVAGLVSFVSLTITTYLGYLLRMTSPEATAQLVARWAASTLVFMFGAAVMRMPESVEEWFGERRTLYYGMLYFALLGLFEWRGIYSSLWISRAWQKLKASGRYHTDDR